MLNYYSSGSIKKIVIAIIAVFIFGAVFILSRLSGDISTKSLSKEEIITRQQAELDRLREEALVNPFTKEDLKKQSTELDRLRKESQAKPLSQEELNKQMEELDKLRLQNN